jgi:hypothetical protein
VLTRRPYYPGKLALAALLWRIAPRRMKRLAAVVVAVLVFSTATVLTVVVFLVLQAT